MNATMAKKLRFGDAVYAIGTTPKALRNWLQRGLVKLNSPPNEDLSWTEYSFIDIAILALTKTFVDFGFNVSTASHMANQTLNFFPQIMTLQKPADAPAGVLALSWTNRRLQVFQVGDEWDLRIATLWESDLARRKMIAEHAPEMAEPGDAEFMPDLPSGIATIRREIEPAAPAYLTVDVEKLLRTAIARAWDSNTEGADDSDD